MIDAPFSKELVSRNYLPFPGPRNPLDRGAEKYVDALAGLELDREALDDRLILTALVAFP